MELNIKKNNYQNEMIHGKIEKAIDLTCWILGSGIVMGVVTTFLYGLINGLF